MKAILQMYPSMPAPSSEEREGLRPIGRNVELYNETVLGLGDIAKAAADSYNQRIFPEMVTIVQKAWTETSFWFDGEFFKVPFPYEGIETFATKIVPEFP